MTFAKIIRQRFRPRVSNKYLDTRTMPPARFPPPPRMPVAMFTLLVASASLTLTQPAAALWKASAGEIGTSVLYDTGNTTQLSAWQTVNCIGNVGGDNELITALGIYKEPSGNLDNFVDKLNITCTKYETNSGDQYQPGPKPSLTTNVYTGPKPRLPGISLKTPLQQNTVSVGVKVVVNTNSHVQDIKLRYKVWNGTNFEGGSVVTTSGATGYGGSEHTVDCPANAVLTGLAVRYSLNSGKIRQIKALCHELKHS